MMHGKTRYACMPAPSYRPRLRAHVPSSRARAHTLVCLIAFHIVVECAGTGICISRQCVTPAGSCLGAVIGAERRLAVHELSRDTISSRSHQSGRRRLVGARGVWSRVRKNQQSGSARASDRYPGHVARRSSAHGRIHADARFSVSRDSRGTRGCHRARGRYRCVSNIRARANCRSDRREAD